MKIGNIKIAHFPTIINKKVGLKPYCRFMNRENLKFYLIFLFALILGISVDYLFYGKPVGISFFVFILIFIVFSLISVKKFGEKLTKIQYLLLGTAILFSAMVFLRTSSFLIFFNIVSALFLFSLFFVLFSKENLSDFNFLKYFISPLSFLLKSFGKSAKFIEEGIDKIQSKKKFGSPEFYSVVRGIIISLPILVLLTWLLSSADVVFQKYLDSLVKVSINPEIVLRILIIIVASYLFIGIFAKAFANSKKSENPSIKNNQSKFLGSIESFIVLGAVELLFLVFILIQFFYLFGGKSYVWGIEEYITYSEYAKNGFGELIAVSLISFLLIYGIDKFGKLENLKEKKIFKTLASILTFEIILIMASAFKRLSLYVDGYGFTFERLMAFIFLFWLFSTFLIFLYKIFSEQRETYFIHSLFWLTILFWLGINILNPDAFIARKNIERHLQGKQLDVWHFYTLSGDAVPQIVQIFELDIDKKIKSEIAEQLVWRYAIWLGHGRLEGEIISFSELVKKNKEVQQWQSFNFSKNEVLEVLDRNSEKIEKYQIEFWKGKLKERKEELKKCEENCEKRYFENPEKIINCRKEECIWERKYCEELQKSIEKKD